MRKIVAALTALTCMLGSQAAMAETLQVRWLTPAANDDLAMIKSISVLRAGGNETSKATAQLISILRDIRIDGENYFDVLNPKGTVQADATIHLLVDAKSEVSMTKASRKRCVKRDEKDKCVESKYLEEDCYKTTSRAGVVYYVSRSVDDQIIHDDRVDNEREQVTCEGDPDPVDRKQIEADFIDTGIRTIRAQIAPTENFAGIRILESRKGLDKAQSVAFKRAVKLTKTDEAEACRVFQEIADQGARQFAVMFNLGLCAEREGIFTKAMEIYTANRESGARSSFKYAINRVNGHLEAKAALEARERMQAERGAGEAPESDIGTAIPAK